MGLTKADRHKGFYKEMKEKGYLYKNIIEKVPKRKRKGFLNNINKSFFESHFGFSPRKIINKLFS